MRNTHCITAKGYFHDCSQGNARRQLDYIHLRQEVEKDTWEYWMKM